MKRLIISAVFGFFAGAITAGILEAMGFENIEFGSQLCLVLIGIWSGVGYWGLSAFFDKPKETKANPHVEPVKTQMPPEPEDGEILVQEFEVFVEPEENTETPPPHTFGGKRAEDI